MNLRKKPGKVAPDTQRRVRFEPLGGRSGSGRIATQEESRLEESVMKGRAKWKNRDWKNRDWKISQLATGRIATRDWKISQRLEESQLRIATGRFRNSRTVDDSREDVDGETALQIR